ncbi:MAG: hypothetical protein LBL82_06755 [Oscillospiraceae bacterium]|nr:hypothetical protein [Oscillospiraceae bacterium]
MKNDIKSFCYYSYAGPFWLIGMFSEHRSNKQLRFHMNQGIILFILEVAALAVYFLLSSLIDVMLVAWIVRTFFGLSLLIAAIGLSMLGMFNVTREKLDPLPYIGKFKILK